MYAITLPSYTQTLFKVLSNNNPVYYGEYLGALYYSNGTDSGRIEAGAWYPWALPSPSNPTIATISGALYKGWYQVAVSYFNGDTGEEGGISPSSNYELAAGSGLRVTLPAATPGATHVNIYVSTVNGSIPMYVGTVTTGTATFDYVTTGSIGREANQRYESPIPAGIPFIHNSRLCTYVGNTIYVGIAARPGYYVATDPRLEFPSDVTNAISGQNGIYVTADKTYWFAGTDLLDVQNVIDVLPFGGIPGTAFNIPHKPLVGWFSPKGFVIADISGNVETPMLANIDLIAPVSGRTVVFSSDGYYRVVSCGWCMNLENTAASQYTDYDFTSISGTYATGNTGIYDLASAGALAAHVGLGKESFGSENLKHLPACYLGVSSEAPMELRVTTPDAIDYRYEARSSAEELRIQRVDPGRGLRSNWYDLSLYNTEGSVFTLASVSFAPVASSRRI